MIPNMPSLRRVLIVQLSQRPVQLKLLLRQHGQFGVVAAALGLGNERAELALAALDGCLLRLLDGTRHLRLGRHLGFSQQRLSKQPALGVVWDGFHGVLGAAAGQCLQSRIRCKPLKP